MADPGVAPPPPRLTFLDQTEGRKIFLRPPPPCLSQGLDDRPLSEGRQDPPLNKKAVPVRIEANRASSSSILPSSSRL